MKIYGMTAPNPKRVRMFVEEKNLEIPFETVDLAAGDASERFGNRSPLGRLPVLELDDGTLISESVAICRFLELEYPNPPLMGVGALEQAEVEMWNRRIELGLFRYIADYFQHTVPFFKDSVHQVPEYAEAAKASAREQLAWLDGALADRRFIAGDSYSIADITAQVAIDLGTPSVITIGTGLKDLSRWHTEVSARASAR